MRKHLLSNWINIIGVFIGLYLIIFILAVYQLFTGARGFTFETVIVEMVGGSLMYFLGAVVYNFNLLLIFVSLLFVVDAVLYYLLKEKIKLILILEIIIFTSFFVAYCIMEQSFNFLMLQITFTVTQWIRRKKLFKDKTKKFD